MHIEKVAAKTIKVTLTGLIFSFTHRSCYSSSFSINIFLIMPSNIEIKAHLRNPDFVRKKALELSGSDKMEILHQCDTFFHCPNGRLKLREFKVLLSSHKQNSPEPTLQFLHNIVFFYIIIYINILLHNYLVI